jgi:signal transduction histidine kinase
MAMEELRELRASLRRGEPRDPAATTRLLDHVLSDLEEANGGAHRIARIVKDLETLGRPDPERTRTQLGFVVEEAMRWMPAFVATRADLRVERGACPDVLASSGQLAQVVVNLVTNAARAIPEGKRGRVLIRVGVGDGGRAFLEVEDDGVGMTPAVMARIYDPFFTTRAVGDGKGLGLAVTHAIVKAHGGTIAARSEPGQGSTFRVELPAAQPVERPG